MKKEEEMKKAGGIVWRAVGLNGEEEGGREIM